MAFEALREQKYLNLETFRKNGQGVKTPIWFAADPNADLSSPAARLYAYTMGESGKVKRIRNNGRARIAPCTARGNVTGPWVDATAQIITGPEAAQADGLLNKKYWPWKQLLNFFASFRPGHTRNCFVIRPA
jgi:PPOX class probable F420-dependent enzyme